MARARTILEGSTVKRSADRFHQPENFDVVEEGKGWVMMAGGNDWEGCATAAAVIFTHNDGDSERIWIKLKFPKELKAVASGDAEQSKRPDAVAHAKKMWKAWLAAARQCHKEDEFSNWKRAFEEAAKSGGDFAEEWGMDRTNWKSMNEAKTIVSRLLEDGERAPEPAPDRPARQVPHASYGKWTGARKSFDELWALKKKALDLYSEMGRSIRYNQALAELGYTREDAEGPVPANAIASTDNMPPNHPGRRWFRSYAQRFPDAVVGAKLKGGGILFFNNPHNPHTGNPDYPTYADWAAKKQGMADYEKRVSQWGDTGPTGA